VSKVMVRYKVKPELVEENERLVRAVYEELDSSGLGGLRYATFRLDDGVSFVHIASNETEDGQTPLLGIAAFREFLKDVQARCVEPPVTVELHEVGSFRFWQ
jgi:hypothetical protein